MSWMQPGAKVAIIGDSHMEALGPRLSRALPSQLGVGVTNVEARRGWSARRYLRETSIPQLVQGADVVIVELGGNDASARISPQAHASDVGEMIRLIGDKRLVWVGPGVTQREDLRALRAPIRQAQRQVVRSAGGEYIDGRDVTRMSDLRADGVHFSGEGYDRMTSQLMPWLAAAGDARRWWIGATAVGAGALFALGAWYYSR